MNSNTDNWVTNLVVKEAVIEFLYIRR